MSKAASSVPAPQFPAHQEPRVWLLSSGASPIGVALARQLLAHGDHVIFGTKAKDVSESNSQRAADFSAFWTEEVLVKEGWKGRAEVIGLDASEGVLGIRVSVKRLLQTPLHLSKSLTSLSAARVKVRFDEVGPKICQTNITLACLAMVGTVEELGASPRTCALIRDQFETNYFGHINLIKAAIPSMRRRGRGHIILLTGISGHLGTPGLGMYCASQWAIEGFCDSLAYEIAPFNIKLTIVQPNMEINVLANQITAAPQLPEYAPENNAAPLFREIVGGMLNRLEVVTPTTVDGAVHERWGSTSAMVRTEVVSLYAQLSEPMKNRLLGETIHALTAIGGHDNPPARHIVGHEAASLVKEKLKMVGEELEDFVEVSYAVDLDSENASPPQRMPDRI